jgi:2-aminoethylphosphonate-pyruvate transaminase
LLQIHDGSQEFEPFLLGGSGTAAVESMLTSLVPDGGRVLLAANGYYSERIADILEVHRIPYTVARSPWLSPIDLDQVGAQLRAQSYTTVVAVHHETTTGRLNDVAALGEIAHAHGARLLVDAMSSFGADPVPMSSLDAVCASANKNLEGLPGVGFVLVRRDLVEAARSYPRRTYYLHLPMYLGESPPLTPPVPMLQAMRQALRETLAETRAGRQARYQAKAALVRETLRAEFPIPAQEGSCTLVMASLPPGWTWDEWFQANLERGFVLYGCKGELRERFFQVSTMGQTTLADIAAWLAVAQELA